MKIGGWSESLGTQTLRLSEYFLSLPNSQNAPSGLKPMWEMELRILVCRKENQRNNVGAH
jgi:hypothetical protein